MRALHPYFDKLSTNGVGAAICFQMTAFANDRYCQHAPSSTTPKICYKATMTILEKLLEAARHRPMSKAEQEAQRRSFAYGNAHIENGRITREMIDRAADQIGDRVG